MTERLGRIMAFLDGEMSRAQRKAFEAEMAADHALAAEVAAHRELGEKLRDAYDPVADEAVPLALTLAAEAANDLPLRRLRLAWVGMAACLVVGVLAGRFVLPPDPKIGIGTELAPRSGLARALEGQLAPQPGPVRIGLTFKDGAGRYCRTFQSRRNSVAGLACREDGAWRVRTATRWMPADAPAYRTAASELPPEVLAAVDRELVGEVLDAAQERAARDRGWR
jgi:hypothetical protein